MGNESIRQQPLLSRRDILRGTVVATAAVAVTNTVAATKGHAHAGNPHGALIDSAQSCLKTAGLCLDHCLEMFKGGDTSLAECAESVNELQFMVTALAAAATSDSKYLKGVAAICMDACRDCENECRKHEKTHVVCKDCADACVSCREECEKIV